MKTLLKLFLQVGLIGLLLIIYYVWFISKGDFIQKLSVPATMPFIQADNHQAINLNLTDYYIANLKKSTVETKEELAFPPSRYYCDDPEIQAPTSRQEGKGKPDWKLKQVQVVIRHGNRVPLKFDLYERNNIIPNFCNIKDDVKYTSKYPLLVEYSNAISKQYLAMQDKLSLFFKFYGLPLPLSTLCAYGQLTTQGVLQQLKNGLLLRETYIQKHKLLDSKSLYHTVQVKSTKLHRTVQSAFAFFYGFLPDCDLFKIPFSFAAGVSFCESSCDCKRANGLKSLINPEKYQLYVKRQTKNPVIKKLASISQMDDHSGVLLDSLVTGFLCQSLELPCNNTGYCITNADLDVVMNEQEYMNKHLLEKTPLRNQSMLNMQPMLKMISNEMQKKIRNDKDALNMLLYSGHDTTVTPLLQALGLPEFRWPRLASMLIFELWEKDEDFYLKIIFNGVDVTSELSFCKGMTPKQGCPYKTFQDFVKTGIPKTFGFETRKEACAAT